MPNANEIKSGCVVELDDKVCIAQKVEVQTPSARGASTLYKVRFNELKTGQKVEKTFKGTDFVKDVDLLRTEVSYSFKDGELYCFMDMSDYNQYYISGDIIAQQIPWMVEGQAGIIGMFLDGNLIAIELPRQLSFEIIETSPAVKSGTSNRGVNKPAIISTGTEVQVPESIAMGDMIKIETETGKFVSKS